jgi:hypothetical protein
MNPFAYLNRIITAEGERSYSAWEDRKQAYDLWEAYYHNYIYDATGEGGLRAQINAALGNASATDLAGLYNPIAEVVDLYQHVYGGEFRASDTDKAEDEPTDIRAQPGREAAPGLLPALDRLWAWSNINVSKQTLCRLPAQLGTCGIRIVAQNDPDPARRRVYLKPEHPRIIKDAELDERGNVTAIELEYDQITGLGDQQEVVKVREIMTKEEIGVYRVSGGSVQPLSDTSVYPNLLGVVPYVLVPHQSTGDAFGLNAFYRVRVPVDRTNAQATHLNTQILDHVKVDWLMAMDGVDAPTEIPLTGRRVLWVKLKPGAAPPLVEPLVAPLVLSDAITKLKLDIELIEDRLPELKAVVGKFLSGQSGETIAQLRRPAEDRLALARAHYEDALVRASQIAVSWMILLGVADLGTGQGSRDAADRAYREGREDFTLNRRPLLPPITPKQSAPVALPVAPERTAERVTPRGEETEEQPAEERRALPMEVAA